MRKYFYLITEHEEDERVGCVSVYDSPKTRPLKGEEGPITVLDEEAEGFRDVGKQVKLGYADFEDEAAYEEAHLGEIMRAKIREVDREWAQKAGVEDVAYDTEKEIATDGGQDLQDHIRAELEEVGPSGMDPLILAARIEHTLNETVEALEEMVEAGDAEYVQQRSYQGRYRLTDAAPEAPL